VRAALVAGAAALRIELGDLHGVPLAATAQVEVREPEPGTIFTALRSDELPAHTDPRDPAIHAMAVGPDLALHVVHDCRLFHVAPSGALEHLAGNGTCIDYEPVQGPARDVPLPGDHVTLDPRGGRLFLSAGSGPNAILDLAGGWLREALQRWGGPLFPAADGSLRAVSYRSVSSVDLDEGEPRELLALADIDACDSGDLQRVNQLFPEMAAGTDLLAVSAGVCTGGPDARAGVLMGPPGGPFEVVLQGDEDGSAENGASALNTRLRKRPALAVDPAGRLVAADVDRIFRVEDGVVHLLTGPAENEPRDHVPALQSSVTLVTDLYRDAGGHLWILDAGAVRVIW
jgi:hypothetical protein